MRTLLISLSLALLALTAFAQSCAGRRSRVDDEIVTRHFGARAGCFLVHDRRTGTTRSFGERCDEALPPASTFKVLHSMIGLETEAVDRDTVFRYDGSAQPFKSWKRDHTLKSAFQNSVVWAYQQLAARIGEERMEAWLGRVGYGAGRRGPLDRFWLDGSWTVTARDQLRLMRRLLDGDLPFSQETFGAVRDMMDAPWSGGGVFGGKTGTHKADGRLQAGWFMGHLETDEASLAFVTLLRGQDGVWGRDARQATQGILRDLGY